MNRVRNGFTEVILAKNSWQTERSIEALFNKCQGHEIESQLRELKKRAFDNNLAAEFNKSLNLLSSRGFERKHEAASDSSKVSGKLQHTVTSLTSGSIAERLHRGTQASIMLCRSQVSPHFDNKHASRRFYD